VRFAYVATALTFVELVVLTFRYNPPSAPRDVYPVTPAMRVMSTAEIDRMAAYSWSFIPNTPGFYRLEDTKTTDPMQGRRYKVLLQKNLKLDPSDYNQTLSDVTAPFLDFLNVRFLYVPPDHEVKAAGWSEVYRGPDGMALFNSEALPRYFIPAAFEIDGSFASVAAKTPLVSDFRDIAFVDHVPEKIKRLGADFPQRGGVVEIVSYRPNETRLRVQSRGWNLLVSSDAHSPGWRAYWNDERIPPVIVNGAFLGCFVPPGNGVLRFRYAPEELDDAFRACGMGLLLMIIVAVVGTRRRVAVT
jgi:hypothetical protein